ncbi:hypothetical protein IQ07DRAFT_10135 [Pyrenochaeta sp. DS3sAY3a]|nr:hypothetical protein IQ07DRAFT_10135 [Pyrenochaeta sp. DS3sAY3a]
MLVVWGWDSELGGARGWGLLRLWYLLLMLLFCAGYGIRGYVASWIAGWAARGTFGILCDVYRATMGFHMFSYLCCNDVACAERRRCTWAVCMQFGRCHSFTVFLCTRRTR